MTTNSETTGPTSNIPTYHQLTLARSAERSELIGAHGADASAIYFWDPSTSLLTSATNVTVDPNISSSEKYILQADVYAFHSSAADMKNLFNNNANNLQILFQAQTQQSGELFTWIVQAGISLASAFLGGSDNQSVAVGGSSSQLTNFPSSQDQITIETGNVTVAFGLAAQKTGGWWDNFLKAIGSVANSPLFAVVPMAKLATQTVSAVQQMTSQVESQEKITSILQGNKLDCRISGGDSSVPFVLRSGFWIIANYAEIKPLVNFADGTENLESQYILDLASEQYALVDKSKGYAPVDITYAVMKIGLTSKSS
jgi:hypothetical protein